MSFRQRLFAVFVFIFLCFYHFFTLTKSPVVWFDEVMLCSEAESFFHEGKLIARVAEYKYGDRQILAYGPVYFFLTTLSFKVGGFGVFQYRVVNLIFYWISLLFFYKVISVKIADIRWRLAAVLLLAIDPLVLANAHSGRMEMVGVAFALIALHIVLSSKPLPRTDSATEVLVPYRNQWLSIAISGFFMGISFLTTPRLAMIGLGIGVVLFVRFLRARTGVAFAQMTLWGGIIICLYLIWSAYAFGLSANNYAASFDGVMFFLGGNFKIPSQILLLVAIGFLSFIWVLKDLRMRLFEEELLTVSIVTIVSFYFIVMETGFYSTIVIPFFIIFIVYALFKNSNKAKYAIFLLLFYDIAFWGYKGTSVVLEARQRNPYTIQDSIAKYVAKGSHVVGNDRFYYACRLNGNAFQYYELHMPIDSIVMYHKTIYDYDYLIISTDNDDKKILKEYQAQSELVLLKEIKLPAPYFKLPFTSRVQSINSYNCLIYKRIKNQ